VLLIREKAPLWAFAVAMASEFALAGVNLILGYRLCFVFVYRPQLPRFEDIGMAVTSFSLSL
jgi:hypothetical protein